MSVDFTEHQQQLSSNSFAAPNAGVSTGSTTAAVPDLLDNIQNYSITTEINDSGKGSPRISRTHLRRSVVSLQVSVVKRAKNTPSTSYLSPANRYIPMEVKWMINAVNGSPIDGSVNSMIYT